MEKRSKEKIKCPFCPESAKPIERSSQKRHHNKYHGNVPFKEGRVVGQAGLSFAGVSQPKTRKSTFSEPSDTPVSKRQRVEPDVLENKSDFPDGSIDTRQALELSRYQSKSCACAETNTLLKTNVKELSATNKMLAEQVSKLTSLVGELTRAQTEQQDLKAVCRDRKWVVVNADGSRAWCQVCSKWAHLTAKTGTQKCSPWINEGYDLAKIRNNGKRPNQAFDWHEGANLSMHSVSMELERSQQTLWDLNGVQKEMDTTKNMGTHRVPAG